MKKEIGQPLQACVSANAAAAAAAAVV